jgi:hypothetical protein
MDKQIGRYFEMETYRGGGKLVGPVVRTLAQEVAFDWTEPDPEHYR